MRFIEKKLSIMVVLHTGIYFFFFLIFRNMLVVLRSSF